MARQRQPPWSVRAVGGRNVMVAVSFFHWWANVSEAVAGAVCKVG